MLATPQPITGGVNAEPDANAATSPARPVAELYGLNELNNKELLILYLRIDDEDSASDGDDSVASSIKSSISGGVLTVPIPAVPSRCDLMLWPLAATHHRSTTYYGIVLANIYDPSPSIIYPVHASNLGRGSF